jgi:hypothetical protein
VFSLVVDPEAMSAGGQLARLFASRQSLDMAGVTDRSVLCRDLCHSIAGFVDGRPGRPLRVFVSHTKRYSAVEMADEVSNLVGHVRAAIGDTHMLAFFDEADLQPGMTWQDELIAAAESSALLVVRTDLYASREWCQNEVLAAKRADMPIVALQALDAGEERGCFLMDHVPSVAVRTPESPENQRPSIDDALNKLVDEALKRSLWRQQRERLGDYGFDWLPANAPEPATLAHWLRANRPQSPTTDKLFVMHPDPPLGTAELAAINDLVAIAAPTGPLDIEILTPRTFASRGGQTPQ